MKSFCLNLRLIHLNMQIQLCLDHATSPFSLAEIPGHPPKLPPDIYF